MKHTVVSQIVRLFFILSLTLCINVEQVATGLAEGIKNITYDLRTKDNNLGMDCLKIAIDPISKGVFGVFHHVNQATHYSELYIAEMDLFTQQWTNTTKIS